MLSLAPNPATTSVTVNYNLENVQSATLLVVSSMGVTQQTVALNVANNSSTLQLTSLPAGNYTLVLVCDGTLCDAKSLQKL